MTREGRIKDWYFINWQNLYHFFITITLALLSKSNGKKEVIEKIQKWLNEESIYFTMEEAPYLHIQNLDFQINIKKPNQSIYSYKDKPDSIKFGTYASLTEEDKKAFVASKIMKKSLIFFGI